MAESESQPYLPGAGEGEVERLLREAETLTQEVARATGASGRNADALLSGELTAAADPLAAVEAASSSVMSLEDLLGELGAGEPAGDRADEKQDRSSETHRLATGAPASRAPAAIPQATRRGKSDRVDISPRRSEPRIEHMPTAEAESAGGSDERTSADDAAGTHANDLETGQNAAARTAPAKTLRKPLIRRMVGGVKAGVGGLTWGILLIARDLPVGILAGFDLPFRRTPRTIKNAIGIIGAITVGMGALAWALPDLMRPRPTQAAPSGDSHAPAAQDSAGHDSGQGAGH